MKINWNLSIRAESSKDLGISTAYNNFTLDRSQEMGDGSETYDADLLFNDERTLADGVSETLDVADGTLTDGFGDSIAMVKLKALFIKNTSTDANLLIGGAAATQMGLFSDVSDVLKLPPSGQFLFTSPDATGIDVTTNSDLKLAHDGTGITDLTYEIIIAGSSS